MFSAGISTLWIIHSPLPKGSYKTNPHSHEFFHLMYILKGQIEIKLNDTDLVLHEGMMSVIPPNQVHSVTGILDETDFFESKFFALDPELSNSLLRLPNSFKTDTDSKNIILLLLNDIYKRGIFEESSINSGMYYILNRIVDIYAKESSSSIKEDKMVNYIKNNASNNITLDEIAESAGYSPNYASTLFRKNHGITMSKYINRLRIQKACELIAYSDLPIVDVCKMCGFSDIHNFGRTFKQLMGISPGRYRHAHDIKDVHIMKNIKNQQPLDEKYFTLAVAAQRLIHYSNLESFLKNVPKNG